MPKVTQKLLDTWRFQKVQMLEERTHTQNGTERSAADIEIVDFDIAVMDKLMSLPVGTKFDAQEIQRELREERSK